MRLQLLFTSVAMAMLLAGCSMSQGRSVTIVPAHSRPADQIQPAGAVDVSVQVFNVDPVKMPGGAIDWDTMAQEAAEKGKPAPSWIIQDPAAADMDFIKVNTDFCGHPSGPLSGESRSRPLGGTSLVYKRHWI